MKEKIHRCEDCGRFDRSNGWCMVTARIVTPQSLRNCRFFLKDGSTARHDETNTQE